MVKLKDSMVLYIRNARRDNLSLIGMMQENRSLRILTSIILKKLHSSLFYLMPEDFLFGKNEDKINVRKEKLAPGKSNRIEVKIAP
jgi:hypothetical protein